MGPLGGLFKMSKSNQQLLDNTTLAQQVAERIVREWSDPSRYDQNCLDLASKPLPAGVTVSVEPLDDTATPTAAPQTLADCAAGGAPQPAPLKRIRVRAASGGPEAEVVLDLRQP